MASPEQSKRLRVALEADSDGICRRTSALCVLAVAIAIAIAGLSSGQAAETGGTIRKRHRASSGARRAEVSPSPTPTADRTPGASTESSPASSAEATPAAGVGDKPSASTSDAKPAADVSGDHNAETRSNAKLAGAPSGSGDRTGLYQNLGVNADHGPIDIRSDSMDLDYKGNQVTFKGHVHVKQSGTLLNSDALKVTYGANFHEMKEIVAQGNVKMEQGGRWATGDRAVLDQVKHTIEMTGSPVIHDGLDSIAGDRILIYIETQKSVVEGARAVIFPRKSENRDNDHNDQGP